MSGTFFEPLAAKDAWFLYAERPQTPLDIGTVYVFEAGSRVPGGRGAAGLEAAISERLPLVPRYRQKVQRVAFYLGHPVWVDDPEFDLSYHVRRAALPKPGDWRQLGEREQRESSADRGPGLYCLAHPPAQAGGNW